MRRAETTDKNKTNSLLIVKGKSTRENIDLQIRVNSSLGANIK